jgi:thymidylate synthase (FAD)
MIMSSTHYNDYSRAPHFIEKTEESDAYTSIVLTQLMADYKNVKDLYSKEVARQILPLSIGVKMMVTINARSLMHLLRLRLCRRNTRETQLLAQRLHEKATQWFQSLFELAGPQCETGVCRQGKMSCQR